MTPLEEHTTQLLSGMMDFQKQNKITRECVSNTQFLLESIKSWCLSKDIYCPLKSKVVIALYTKQVKGIPCPFVNVHLVVETCGKVIDPSYEVSSNKNVLYFKTIGEFVKCAKSIETKEDDLKTHLPFVIKQFIKFKNNYENMKLLTQEVYNHELYERQLDYIIKNKYINVK